MDRLPPVLPRALPATTAHRGAIADAAWLRAFITPTLAVVGGVVHRLRHRLNAATTAAATSAEMANAMRELYSAAHTSQESPNGDEHG